jgi:tetratricopeptide (TPR) repeat protein
MLTGVHGCAARQHSPLPAAQQTQVVDATVEARDPALAAALLKLRLAPSAAQHRVVATEYQRLGILDAAFDQLTAAIRSDPRDATAYDARARLWRQWGYPLMGVADANRAIFYAPKSAAAYNTLGTLLGAAGRFEAARRAFERAVALDPAAAFARDNLSRLDRLASDRTVTLSGR